MLLKNSQNGVKMESNNSALLFVDFPLHKKQT